MTGANQQIVVLYEDEGLSIKDISAQMGFDMTAIKATLMSYSNKYREATKSVPAGNATGSVSDNGINPLQLIDNNELTELKEIALQLARYSEDENVKARMIKFLIDEGKGRNDARVPQKNVKNLKLNVLVVNEHMQRARRAISKSVRQAPKQIIDVTSEPNPGPEKAVA